MCSTDVLKSGGKHISHLLHHRGAKESAATGVKKKRRGKMILNKDIAGGCNPPGLIISPGLQRAIHLHGLLLRYPNVVFAQNPVSPGAHSPYDTFLWGLMWFIRSVTSSHRRRLVQRFELLLYPLQTTIRNIYERISLFLEKILFSKSLEVKEPVNHLHPSTERCLPCLKTPLTGIFWLHMKVTHINYI